MWLLVLVQKLQPLDALGAALTFSVVKLGLATASALLATMVLISLRSSNGTPRVNTRRCCALDKRVFSETVRAWGWLGARQTLLVLLEVLVSYAVYDAHRKVGANQAAVSLGEVVHSAQLLRALADGCSFAVCTVENL